MKSAAGKDTPVQPLRAADQKADRARQRQPAVQASGERGAVEHFAGQIQCDNKRLGWQRGQQSPAFAAFDFGRSAFAVGDFRQCQSGTDPSAITLEQFCFRALPKASDRDYTHHVSSRQ